MDQTTTYLEFKTDLFANTFFDVIKKYHDYDVCCEGKLWVPFSYFTYENNITLKYSNQHNEELTLVLEKKNKRINATSIVKNKYVEDDTDAFYFVDAFQEVMFDAYFLKE